MTSLDLFFIPFAGGNKYSYKPFAANAPKSINLHFLEPAGRGSRMDEPLELSIENIAEDIFRKISARISEKPYAIYGHSMGALITYLVAHKLRLHNLRAPIALYLTGRQAPSIIPQKITYNLPRNLFFKELADMGGTTEEVLQNRSLMEFYEPILRADFQAVETYSYTNPISPLEVPLIIMIGTEEKTKFDHAIEWQKESSCKIELLTFPGNHFFIFSFAERIMKIIEERSNLVLG